MAASSSEEERTNSNLRGYEVVRTLNQADAQLSISEEVEREIMLSQKPDWNTYNPRMAALSPIHRFGEVRCLDTTTIKEVSGSVGSFIEDNKGLLFAHDKNNDDSYVSIMHRLVAQCNNTIIYLNHHEEFRFAAFPGALFKAHHFFVKMTTFKLFVVVAGNDSVDSLFKIIDYFFYKLH